jgi:ribosome-binding protein aMBF1 (putative translation factor)
MHPVLCHQGLGLDNETMNNEVQRILGELRAKGWTWAAVADELGAHYNTVQKWYSGEREPANRVVVRELERLLARKRIPKRKRYKRNPPAT